MCIRQIISICAHPVSYLHMYLMAYTYLSEYETNICALGDHKTRVSELRTKEVQNPTDGRKTGASEGSRLRR